MVKICIVGCLHGELDKMYDDVQATELKYGFKIDIVLCCGDFQSIRNESDLTVMSVPPKYRRLGDFWKYYAKEKVVPYLTVFVGGNHEASNYLQELPYGGWVAPNVYYMGYAGVVNFMGLRIVGLSGIYKRHDYYTGHYEHAPYDDKTKRTAYHSRNIETFRLKQLKKPVDIVLSHDWPRGIYNYGSQQLERLMREKPHFKEEIETNTLGNPAAEEVLMHLRPRYWFAAHLHCKFAALVQFQNGDCQLHQSKTTKFLALDKCLPFKDYMQFVDIDPQFESGEHGKYLSLDPEWLCVLRSTNHLMSTARTTSIMPTQVNEERCDFSATEEDLKELSDLFNHQFRIPDNFQVTGPIHDEEYEEASSLPKSVEIHINPQTELMCAMLELTHPNAEFLGKSCSLLELSKKLKQTDDSEESSCSDDENNDVDDDDDDDKSSCADDTNRNENENQSSSAVKPVNKAVEEVKIENPEEIDLNDASSEDEESGPVGGNDEAVIEQYDPADYPVEESDKEDENGYCPMTPFV